MDEKDYVVIDTVLQSPFFIHKLTNEGGLIKFKNYPFAVKVVGGGNMTEIQLLAVKVGVKFKTHINPTYKKKQPAKERVEIEEEDSIEL